MIVMPGIMRGRRTMLDGVYNFNASYLSNWAAALNTSAQRRILCVGDSTTSGEGSDGGSGAGRDFRSASYPTQLATKLSTYGSRYTAQSDGRLGFDSGALSRANLKLSDPKLSGFADWAAGAGTPGGPTNNTGGAYLDADTKTTSFGYTPTTSFDTIRVHTITNSFSGLFDINVDGGSSLGTMSVNQSQGHRVFTRSCALGTHTINITRVSGIGAYISGIEVYDSTSPNSTVLNAGFGGSKSADWVTSGFQWNPSQYGAANRPVDTISPDLTIICLGINDLLASVATATIKTNIQTLITAYKSVGDVVLKSPNPISTAGASVADQDALNVAYKELAVSNNCVMADSYLRYGSTWAAANTSGLMTDNNHPNSTGYASDAAVLADILRSV